MRTVKDHGRSKEQPRIRVSFTRPREFVMLLVVVGTILTACTSSSSPDSRESSIGSGTSAATALTTDTAASAASSGVADESAGTEQVTTSADTQPPLPAEEQCRERAQSIGGAYVTFAAFCGDFPSLYALRGGGSRQPTLTESIEALFEGTGGEARALGFRTGFDGGIARGVEVSATVDPQGVARLRFTLHGEPWNPGVSASAETLSIYDPLVATVFLHADITALDLAGLCWGELDCTGTLERRTWETQLFLNQGTLSYRTPTNIDLCGLEAATRDPERCTVRGVFATLTISGTVADVASGDTLNLRSGPGVEYPVVAEAEPNSSVVASELRAASTDGNPWRLIRDLSGAAGWANEAFLELPRSSAGLLAESLIDFAQAPSSDSFAAVPLAAEVSLGLGPDIDLASVPADDLLDPENWIIDRPLFRAYEGPFSALDMLSRGTVFDSSTGDHPHCASPPVPAPDGFEHHRRISIQPSSTTTDSCLQWFTVDLFVGDSDQIEAITLDLWEP